MAFVGLSLIAASVVGWMGWLVFQRPLFPFFQTLLAIWRGDPRIDQPPNTRQPGDTSTTNRTPGDENRTSPAIAPPSVQEELDRAAMPPPKILRPSPQTSNLRSSFTSKEASPQTTPKANAALPSESVPSFSLSPSAPPSAAAIARATDAAFPSAPSSLSSAATTTPSTLMPPPPRPPTLNNINNSSMLSAAPARNLPLPNRLAGSARQPGTSTLAPPPTHSSKPAKPSRKVVLEPGHSPLDWARLANDSSSDLRNLPTGTPYLKVSPSMLKRQTGRKGKDAWTALGGRVYNITPYLPFHPGGEPELLRAAGRDGTKLFGEIHPWVNYEGMLATSLIGILVADGEEKGNGAMDDMD